MGENQVRLAHKSTLYILSMERVGDRQPDRSTEHLVTPTNSAQPC